jgi:methyltransferase family protein
MPIANKVTNFIRGNFKRLRGNLQKRRYLAKHRDPEPDIVRSEWKQSLTSPTEFYLRCLRFFDTNPNFPEELRSHRAYFAQSRRGFGEDAFHVMWFLLFNEFRPTDFLEIGVYRGQVLSLASLLQSLTRQPGEIVGISPFESIGDSVSKYRRRIDYLSDTHANFAHFGLLEPTLFKAFSKDVATINLITSRPWDCIYIDGNHDYEIAKADWNVCSASIKPGGLIVLDDAALDTAFEPPIFATKGHPGPSRVAAEINRSEFEEILQVGHNRVFQKLPAK